VSSNRLRVLTFSWLALGPRLVVRGTGLSAFHAGVEWKWWPGPRDCSGPLDSLGAGNLLRDLQSIHVGALR
jgi:disulfide bond formation protein DsbB